MTASDGSMELAVSRGHISQSKANHMINRKEYTANSSSIGFRAYWVTKDNHSPLRLFSGRVSLQAVYVAYTEHHFMEESHCTLKRTCTRLKNPGFHAHRKSLANAMHKISSTLEIGKVQRQHSCLSKKVLGAGQSV